MMIFGEELFSQKIPPPFGEVLPMIVQLITSGLEAKKQPIPPPLVADRLPLIMEAVITGALRA